MDPDTKIGGAAARFPRTRRSAIVDAGSSDAEIRTQAWQSIVAAYWKPAYKYLRVKWNLSNEDAKDLTQTFFTRAIEKEFFRAYDPGRASFRTYLRTCLDGFAANENKSARRLKRGGGVEPLALDFETAEKELTRHGTANLPVENLFHQEFVRSLFGLALGQLRRECADGGRQVPFRVFERYDLGEHEERPTYAQLASELGISTAAATNHLASMRRRFRRIVLDKLREITANEREFRSESRDLLGIED